MPCGGEERRREELREAPLILPLVPIPLTVTPRINTRRHHPASGLRCLNIWDAHPSQDLREGNRSLSFFGGVEKTSLAISEAPKGGPPFMPESDHHRLLECQPWETPPKVIQSGPRFLGESVSW